MSAAVHPRVVLFALATGGFAIGTTEFATMSLLPAFAADLRIDAPTAGHVISAYALGVVAGAPVIAALAAKMARRTLLILLMAAFALTNAASALAPSYGALMVARFFCGMPHGAYFGVAALVAADVAPEGRKAQAVGWVMTGLTVATIVGVPLANVLGQAFGWRWGFAVVAGLAVVTAVLLAGWTPYVPPHPEASAVRELRALRNPQIWLTLGAGAIGFGGIFAVYTYLASTLVGVTHVSERWLPLVLVVFGLGMTIGNLGAAWLADRALLPTAAGLMVVTAGVLLSWPWAAGHVWSLMVMGFMVGVGGGLGTPLQTRLMQVAGEAQTIAAALHHSAFNCANALGPWLAGLAIAGGYGLTSAGPVGAALSLGGLAVLGVSVWVAPRRV